MANHHSLDPETLYETYAPMVLRRCRTLLVREELAVEAMQETFVRFLQQAKTLNPDDSPSSYFFTIATHVCLNQIRHQKRRPETHDDAAIESIQSPHNLNDTFDDQQKIISIFSQSKPDDQKIAAQFFDEGMTHKELAEKTGLSVSGVRLKIRKFLEKAKKENRK